MIGHLDEVRTDRVRGWAASPEGQPVELILRINDADTMTVCGTDIRADLTTLPRNDLGFHLNLPKRLRIGDVVSVVDRLGNHLSGSPRTIGAADATREEKALWLISHSMKVLEIGPSYNPLAPRAKGWDSYSLDHATQEELIAKYRGQQAIERIEPVDYLWRGGPLESAVPRHEHGTFDAVIASHVIEHMPDPVSFLLSIAVLLKNGGILSLVVPDKRRIFDYFHPLTLTSDYLYSYNLKRTRHTKKTAFDYVAYNVSESGEIVWHPRLLGKFSFIGEDVLNKAKEAFDRTVEDESSPYADYHATKYTPSSFALIMLELGQIGLLPFREEVNFPTSGCEFYVSLRKEMASKLPPSILNQKRMALLKGVVRELGQQAQWLLDEGN